MSPRDTLMLGTAALFAAGAVGWELSRRRAEAEMRQRTSEPDDHELYLSERDVWQSVSEDIEPTLLGNPDAIIEFHQERAEEIEAAEATEPQRR